MVVLAAEPHTSRGDSQDWQETAEIGVLVKYLCWDCELSPAACVEMAVPVGDG